MTAALVDPKSATERLCKLLGMLGSSHDGERAAAAFKAHEFLRQLGLGWRDVIAVPADWQRMARLCREQAHRLSPKEFDFISNIAMARYEPSEKQMRWLRSIFTRLGGKP